MRRLEFQKELIVLTEKQWEGFVKRYDIKEAKKYGGEYQIVFDCPTCFRDESRFIRSGCRNCTFEKLRISKSKTLGCWMVLRKLIKQKLKKSLPKSLMMSPRVIYWKIKDHEAVEEVFKVIQEALASMEKSSLCMEKY